MWRAAAKNKYLAIFGPTVFVQPADLKHSKITQIQGLISDMLMPQTV